MCVCVPACVYDCVPVFMTELGVCPQRVDVVEGTFKTAPLVKTVDNFSMA